MSFGPLSLDRPSLRDTWDVLLGVVGDLTISVDGRLFLAEEMFPVTELAAALQRWLETTEHDATTELVYESLESDDAPLLQFTPGWTVSSSWQLSEERRVFTLDELRDAARHFIDELRREANTQLGVDIDVCLKPGSETQRHLLNELGTMANAIARDMPGVSARAYAELRDTSSELQAGISCILDHDDEPDLVDLEITIRWIASTPRIIVADVCWGHPSGYVELDVVSSITERTELPLSELPSTLSALEPALRAALRRGRPPTS